MKNLTAANTFTDPVPCIEDNVDELENASFEPTAQALANRTRWNKETQATHEAKAATNATAGHARFATDPEATTGTAENIMVNPKQVKASVDAGMFGVGMSWQDVARAAGTSYQNTTGRSIMVSVTGRANNAGATVYLYVSTDGETWVLVGSVNPPAFYGGQITAIIPPGHFYKATKTAYASVSQWAELRPTP